MPIVSHLNLTEPSEHGVIWCFLDLRKVSDLMASEEVYFRNWTPNTFIKGYNS